MKMIEDDPDTQVKVGLFDQYGLMPERVLGVLVALVLLAHSLKDHLIELIRQGKLEPVPAKFLDLKLGDFEIR